MNPFLSTSPAGHLAATAAARRQPPSPARRRAMDRQRARHGEPCWRFVPPEALEADAPWWRDLAATWPLPAEFPPVED